SVDWPCPHGSSSTPIASTRIPRLACLETPLLDPGFDPQALHSPSSRWASSLSLLLTFANSYRPLLSVNFGFVQTGGVTPPVSPVKEWSRFLAAVSGPDQRSIGPIGGVL